jgi:hypothetical protein
LHPALASDALNDITKLAVMNVFERIFRAASCSENSAFLRRGYGFFSQQPDLREPERRSKSENSPRSYRLATGQIGKAMDAVPDIFGPVEEA